MSGVQSKLETLTAVAKRLNVASDECNEMIGRVEDDITKTGVGLTVWLSVEIAPSDWRDPNTEDVLDEFAVRFWRLGYAKISEGWSIVAKQLEGEITDDAVEKEITAPMPLVKAPRHVRLEAVTHLEQLVEHLTDAAQRYLTNVEQAKSVLSKWDKQAGARIPDARPRHSKRADVVDSHEVGEVLK